MAKTFSARGIVLKRVNTGETDRVVTIITQERGKIALIEKGSRRLKSTKRAALEPGNVVKIFAVERKSLPILTQARLLGNSGLDGGELIQFRRLSELLELFDRLFVEEELDMQLFGLVLDLRKYTLAGESGNARKGLAKLIELLGYPNPLQNGGTISEFVEKLTDRPLKSFEFLTTE